MFDLTKNMLDKKCHTDKPLNKTLCNSTLMKGFMQNS